MCTHAPVPSSGVTQIDLFNDPQCKNVSADHELYARLESFTLSPNFQRALSARTAMLLLQQVRFADETVLEVSRKEGSLKIMDTLKEALHHSDCNKPVLVWHAILDPYKSAEHDKNLPKDFVTRLTEGLNTIAAKAKEDDTPKRKTNRDETTHADPKKLRKR